MDAVAERAERQPSRWVVVNSVLEILSPLTLVKDLLVIGCTYTKFVSSMWEITWLRRTLYILSLPERKQRMRSFIWELSLKDPTTRCCGYCRPYFVQEGAGQQRNLCNREVERRDVASATWHSNSGRTRLNPAKRCLISVTDGLWDHNGCRMRKLVWSTCLAR